MKYDPSLHHRRSIRLREYDYSSAGMYFVTVCAENRECLFGDIDNGEIRMNAAGEMVTRWYWELENKFPDIECDAFVCMPNHVHFIVANLGQASGRIGRTRRSAPTQAASVITSATANERGSPAHTQVESVGADLCVRPITGSFLHQRVQWFKTMTTNDYIRGVRQNDWPPFPGRLWQRNYWERVIRGDPELDGIRDYIQNNPTQWESDTLYVKRETA
jgi:REP element-mobilizing transposase RayT